MAMDQLLGRGGAFVTVGLTGSVCEVVLLGHRLIVQWLICAGGECVVAWAC
jgi:hypothetical protein